MINNNKHNMSSLEFLQYSYFGNTIQHYLIAIAIFVVAVFFAVFLRVLIQKFFKKLAKKTKNELDDTLLVIINKVVVFVMVVGGLYFALRSLNISGNAWDIIEKALQVIFIVKIFQGITIMLDFIIKKYVVIFLKLKDGFDAQLTRMLTRIINIVIWVIAASMVLNLFGYDIGALVTGLGIGGLAIALAAQDPLANFFSSLSLVADKPFKVGDVIKFGTYEGAIKDIGFRTTRIETFFGTVISVPNNTLAKAEVENMSKRQSRRADGAIGIVYKTTPTKIKEGIKIIKEILDKEENITKDFRVFFTEYDPSSLRLEYTYFVKNPQDFVFFLQNKNNINLAIKEKFDEAGIEMAFPTQTLYMAKD